MGMIGYFHTYSGFKLGNFESFRNFVVEFLIDVHERDRFVGFHFGLHVEFLSIREQ